MSRVSLCVQVTHSGPTADCTRVFKGPDAAGTAELMPWGGEFTGITEQKMLFLALLSASEPETRSENNKNALLSQPPWSWFPNLPTPVLHKLKFVALIVRRRTSASCRTASASTRSSCRRCSPTVSTSGSVCDEWMRLARALVAEKSVSSLPLPPVNLRATEHRTKPDQIARERKARRIGNKLLHSEYANEKFRRRQSKCWKDQRQQNNETFFIFTQTLQKCRTFSVKVFPLSKDE